MSRPLPFQRVLAIGAHCDDIEIGYGGTLLRLARHDVPIFGLIVTDTHYERKGVVVRDGSVARKETEAAAHIIGYHPIFGTVRNNDIVVDETLVYLIRETIEQFRVDTVITHWDADAHLDHVRVAHATIMATRDIHNLLMYRSNAFKSVETFAGNLSVDVSDFMDLKISALRCYAGEIIRVGENFIDHVEIANRHDGVCAGVRYAETFSCVKSLL